MSKQVNFRDENTAANLAEGYFKKYRPLVETYERHSAKTMVGESLSAHHIAALGQMLDQQKAYYQFCEASGSLASLGQLPQVALDVIVASQAQSIIPLLASIQPMEEEQGIAYFRETRAAQASGGYTKGQVISDAMTRDNVGDGTLANARKTLVTAQVASQKDYTLSASAPIRPYQVEVIIDGVGMGKDDGQGAIAGIGVQGTVKYETGEVKVSAIDTTNLDASKKVRVMVNLDIDLQDEIERVQSSLKPVPITAEIFARASDVGQFTNFAFSKRFGRSATEEVAQDLTNELTRVLNTRAVQAILNNFTGTAAEWSKSAPSGVSYAEHRLH